MHRLSYTLLSTIFFAFHFGGCGQEAGGAAKQTEKPMTNWGGILGSSGGMVMGGQGGPLTGGTIATGEAPVAGKLTTGGHEEHGGSTAYGGRTMITGGNVGGSTVPQGSGGRPNIKITDLPWVKGDCPRSPTTLNFETAEFCVSLSKNSQTIAALKPKQTINFDFTPADRLSVRTPAGYFHLGDVTMRLRVGATGEWQPINTSASRVPVTALAAKDGLLAAADLAPVLPASAPISITRSWLTEGGRLVMRLELKNKSVEPIQIGALGLPMIFNHILTDRTLSEAHTTCSFADPYIGQDAGYVQVTRLSGQGPALLIIPDGKTPFEAYQPILNAPKSGSKDPVALFQDLTPRGQTFEGFYEWLIHSKAYAEKEWSAAVPWNPASELILAPGESRTYGLRFVLSESIRSIEPTLQANHRPVAVGVPGYILPSDLEGKLFLNFPHAVASLETTPAGALLLSPGSATGHGWNQYTVTGKTQGRVRLDITYQDGTIQTIHYYVTPPAETTLQQMGTFLTSQAWFVDPSDPFGRSPSVMTYDHQANKIVTQTKQAWVCGLGDDGGATWLAGIMKLFGLPVKAEVEKYETFANKVIWGGLQYSTGPQKYGVKRTLFYYEPSLLPAHFYQSSVDWIDPITKQTYWGAWNKAHTLQVPRSYNYPHVAALYYTLYRLARNTIGLVTTHPWDYYLNQAYQTVVAMTTIGNEYSKFGLMDGSIFLEILKDLQREGLATQASDLETRMKAREAIWRKESYPFGSEMAWDSTGQEEVYAWTQYFGDTDKAKVCIDAITGYMPTLPHWGYNGCARRYWDFIYGGAKIDRLERMIHHYGSTLNALPVLTDFRERPEDFYLLRIGYAGMMGTLSNIQADGFPSMAFHAFPDTLDWDAITGDVGLNIFGHAMGTGTYVVNHNEFGWLAFGGNLSVAGTKVTVIPRDSFRQRLYVAPLGLWLVLEAGKFQKAEMDKGSIALTLSPADEFVSQARLQIEQPATIAGSQIFIPTESFTKERDAYTIPLGVGGAKIVLANGH